MPRKWEERALNFKSGNVSEVGVFYIYIYIYLYYSGKNLKKI